MTCAQFHLLSEWLKCNKILLVSRHLCNKTLLVSYYLCNKTLVVSLTHGFLPLTQYICTYVLNQMRKNISLLGFHFSGAIVLFKCTLIVIQFIHFSQYKLWPNEVRSNVKMAQSMATCLINVCP